MCIPDNSEVIGGCPVPWDSWGLKDERGVVRGVVSHITVLTAILMAVGMMDKWVGTITSLSPPDMETRVTWDMSSLGSDHAYIARLTLYTQSVQHYYSQINPQPVEFY